MKEIIKRIEDHYNIKIEKLLEIYELGHSREEMAEFLGLGVFQVRQIVASLGLRMKKKHRVDDLDMLKRRLENEDDLVIQLSNDLEFANKKLLSLNKFLQKYKDENTYYRKQQRLLNRDLNFIEKVSNEIISHINNFDVPNIKVENKSDKNGLNLICLADLHIGAKVNKEEVGDLNEYNYNIAIERINKTINACLNMKNQSDNLTIVLLGDIFDGIIHNSYLIADMPVTKAIAEFSSYFIFVLKSLKKVYKNINVEIVAGNHDRLTENPTIIHKNYDFSHMFYELVKLGLKEYNINVKFGFKGYHLIDLPNNKKGFVFHGDMNRSYSPCKEGEILKIMSLCKQIFNVEPSLLLSGHYHTYIKTLLPNKGYAISLGSLLGTNQYSYTNGWLNTIPNQTILFYNEDGELIKEKVVQVD